MTLTAKLSFFLVLHPVIKWDTKTCSSPKHMNGKKEDFVAFALTHTQQTADKLQ